MSRAEFPKPKFVAQPPSESSAEVPVRSGNQRYWDISDVLRSQPGRWALIAVENTWDNTVGTTIRKGLALAFKPVGAFEAKRFIRVLPREEREEYLSRGLRIEKVAEVYARYVGEPDEN